MFPNIKKNQTTHQRVYHIYIYIYIHINLITIFTYGMKINTVDVKICDQFC